jgi:hypothetical protein
MDLFNLKWSGKPYQEQAPQRPIAPCSAFNIPQSTFRFFTRWLTVAESGLAFLAVETLNEGRRKSVSGSLVGLVGGRIGSPLRPGP